MDAVISLCIFCEEHGPRILFTTQVFYEDDGDAVVNLLPPNESPDSGSCELLRGCVCDGDEQCDDEMSTRKRYYGSYVMLQQHVDELHTTSVSLKRCKACTSSDSAYPSFLTNDDIARCSYVGSQWPYRQPVHDMVRHACLRSLSCEIPENPDRQGLVFFGDEENGYCMSYTFCLRDSEARGFQHLYSIVIVAMDKLLLLNSNYDFLVKGCETVIGRLQSACTQLFDQEQSKGFYLRKKDAKRAQMFPKGFLKCRAGSGESKTRSLAELCNDPNIFSRLHEYFVWMLRTQTRRCVEFRGALDGRAIQDVQVSFEEAVASHAEEMDRREQSQPRDDDDELMIGDSFHPQPMFFVQPSSSSATLMPHALDERVRPPPLQHDQPLQLICDLQTVANRLAHRQQLDALLGALVVGEQLVVRGGCAVAVQRVLESLACLLPRGCTRIVYYAQRYHESYRCNLLGIDADVALPNHVNVTQMLVTTNDEHGRFVGLNQCSIELLAMSPTRSNATVCSKLVGRYKQLLVDASLSSNVLDMILRATREEWLNKAKLFYQHKMQHGVGDDADRARRMRILLNIAKCGNADVPVVEFWQRGLSHQYKTYVRDTCRNSLNTRISGDPQPANSSDQAVTET